MVTEMHQCCLEIATKLTDNLATKLQIKISLMQNILTYMYSLRVRTMQKKDFPLLKKHCAKQSNCIRGHNKVLQFSARIRKTLLSVNKCCVRGTVSDSRFRAALIGLLE